MTGSLRLAPLLLVLAACATAPRAADPAPGGTYALVTLDAPDARLGQYALCRPDAGGRIELAFDLIVTCRGPGLILGTTRPEDPPRALPDGTLYRLVPLRPQGLLERVAPGVHVLAARALGARRPDLLEDSTLHEIMPGRIHYLGAVDAGGVVWRDPGDLGPRLAAALGVAPDRVVTERPARVTLSCRTGRSPECRVDRAALREGSE